MQQLRTEISKCSKCADRFGQATPPVTPRPVIWFDASAKILIAGQAPGMRVYQSGVPFLDRSGDRLRDWLGVSSEQFYNKSNFAILPMAFCFPGYSAKGADLPPPPICAKTWRSKVLAEMRQIKLTLLIGGYAQNWHLGCKGTVSNRVEAWKDQSDVFMLPHPSWRNNSWVKSRPWFETDLIPALHKRVAQVLNE